MEKKGYKYELIKKGYIFNPKNVKDFVKIGIGKMSKMYKITYNGKHKKQGNNSLYTEICNDSKLCNKLKNIPKGSKKINEVLNNKFAILTNLIIETKENKAATKIKAAIRGKMTRNKIKSNKAAVTKIQAAVRGKMTRNEIKIINKLKNLGKNSKIIVKTKNNANLKIKYANKNKQTPINHNVNLNNNQVLITIGGLEAPGHSLSNKFKNHRSKYFKSTGKKGVWELKNKYKL